MGFILYFILRKLFVKLEFSQTELRLEKGLILKRVFVLPYSSAVRISRRKTLLMRIFRAWEVEVSTLRGNVKFYLKNGENLPFLESSPPTIKTSPAEQLFGAFAATRALAGVTFFVAVMRKIGSVFGSEYYNRVISVFFRAADSLEKPLRFLHIAVPRITAAAAIFAVLAWTLAFLMKFASLARFRVGRRRDVVYVSSGFITLYEHALVRNSAAAVSCFSLVSVIFDRAPLYLRGVMIHPAVSKAQRRRVLKTLCGIEVEEYEKVTPPVKAFFGYCTLPILSSVLFGATLTLLNLSGYKYAELIKTLLYGGLAVSVYTTAVYFVYMRRTGIAFYYDEISAISVRRRMRLYTAVLPSGTVCGATVSQSVFRLLSGRCDLTLLTREHAVFKARQLPRVISRLQKPVLRRRLSARQSHCGRKSPPA